MNLQSKEQQIELAQETIAKQNAIIEELKEEIARLKEQNDDLYSSLESYYIQVMTIKSNLGIEAYYKASGIQFKEEPINPYSSIEEYYAECQEEED